MKRIFSATRGTKNIYWLKYAQQSLSTREETYLKELCPYIDEMGIKRACGRLKNSEIFNHDRKHPIILPANSPVSYLILHDIHNDLFHPGPNRVIAESRKKYWIINARRITKSITCKCVTCRRWRGQNFLQIMSGLPWFRINPGKAPFENLSVDYFGPFLIKYGRKQRIKRMGLYIPA